MDSHGEILNDYSGRGASTGGEVPERPWAIYLANEAGLYTLLCFDLDAKHVGLPAVDADTRRITQMLREHDMAYLVCQSGPSGGRHIWCALTDGADPELVRSIARNLARVCPSLDKAPLSNPATGCVRPPWTPHRLGGTSLPIAGVVDTLITPTTTPSQVRALAIAAGELAASEAPDSLMDGDRPLPRDRHGRLYLPGSRRPLPARSADALHADASAGDASSVLWSVLLGAASAHWRFEDILALQDEPGLAHARSMREGARRTPRPAFGDQSAARTLARQWDKAVRFIAGSPRGPGADPTFEPRAKAIASFVEQLQTRADAAAGRWRSGGGPADRRVLDALSLLALRAVSTDVEADIRRIGLICGVGRETARIALLRLEQEGWIRRVKEAEGVHAAHWSIDPQELFHRGADLARSQADPRPEGAGATDRKHLLTDLADRLTASAHDVFTAAGLGIHAGNVYARLHHSPGADDAEDVVSVLRGAGLARWSRNGWRPSALSERDAVARDRGIDGVLRRRAELYELERDLWRRWNGELLWMSTPQRTRPSRRPRFDQVELYADPATNRYGRFPRSADGRADFRAARAVVEGSAGSWTARAGSRAQVAA